MKVVIVGSGYVGLSMGVVLSQTHDVSLIDIDEDKVNAINQKTSPIHEEGIDELLAKNILEGRLKAFTTQQHIGHQEIALVCVGTPSSDDGTVFLDYVVEAVANILERIDEFYEEYLVIGIKSTVIPGSTRKIVLDEVVKRGLSDKVGVVFNPEFLREGTAIADAQNPDRIVIGASDQRAFDVVKKMYEECLNLDDSQYVQTSLESAELCKYVSNSFLATKISFSNEIANIVEGVPNADYDEIMRAVGLDNRISPMFFGAGAGYGGSCFPKDVLGLITFAEKQLGIDSQMLKIAHSINIERPKKLVDMLLESVKDVKGKKISILGLAFKPNTDDTRESPSLKLIDILHELGAEVWVHDPLMDLILRNTTVTKAKTTTDIDQCMDGAAGCILVTDWNDYKEAGIGSLTKLMKEKKFIDGRRVFAKATIPEDVIYKSIGVSP